MQKDENSQDDNYHELLTELYNEGVIDAKDKIKTKKIRCKNSYFIMLISATFEQFVRYLLLD